MTNKLYLEKEHGVNKFETELWYEKLSHIEFN